MSDHVTEGTPAGDVTPEVTETPMEPGQVFDLPYVQKLRNEAAEARVTKREAVEAAVAAARAEHEAVLAEKDVAITEAQNETAAALLELEKLKIALATEVPSNKVLQFAAILQGNDVESLTKSAQDSLDLFGIAKPVVGYDPSAGLGGKPPLPLNGDPILNAMTNILGIKQ